MIVKRMLQSTVDYSRLQLTADYSRLFTTVHFEVNSAAQSYKKNPACQMQTVFFVTVAFENIRKFFSFINLPSLSWISALLSWNKLQLTSLAPSNTVDATKAFSTEPPTFPVSSCRCSILYFISSYPSLTICLLLIGSLGVYSIGPSCFSSSKKSIQMGYFPTMIT